MFKNKKTLRLAIIGLTAILGSLSTTSIVLADVVYGTTCNLMVYPYNPDAASDTLGSAAVPYVNQLNDTNCDNHLFYTKSSSTPAQYDPQPPPDTDNVNSGTPFKSLAAQNFRVPWAHHDHGYFNDKTHTVNFIYKSFVDQFEITIQPDGADPLVGSLNLGWGLSNIKCWNPIASGYVGDDSDLEDCSGSVSDLFGGTTVSKQIVGNKIVVTWKFATNAPNTGRPAKFGNNGNPFYTYDGSGNVTATLNTTNPYVRGLPFAVEIKSDNNSGQTWSATTTSRVLLADLAMNKADLAANHANFMQGCPTNDINNPSTLGWCYLTPSGYPTQTVMSNSVARTYYWYPIGSVGTVWKKPAPPPPAECTNLIVTPGTLNASSPTPMTAKVVVSDGSVHNANILWTPVGGSMSSGNTQSGNTGTSVTAATINNTYNLIDPLVGGSVTVKVTSIAGGVTIPPGGVCANGRQVKTPPVVASCTDLIVTPGTLNASGSTPMTAKVVVSDGSVHNANIAWTPVGGNMTIPNPQSGTTGTSVTASTINNTYNLIDPLVGGSVTVKVTSIAGGVTIPGGGVCQNGRQVKTPPVVPPYCVKLEFSPQPTLSTTVDTPLNVNVIYSDGTNNHAGAKVTWTPNANGTVNLPNPSNPGTGPFSNVFHPTGGSPATVNVKLSTLPPSIDPDPIKNAACLTGTIASSGPSNVCLNLNNSGNPGGTIVGGTSVFMNPNPTNVSAPHPSQVTWSETGAGVLIRNPASIFPFNQDWMCPAVINDTTVSLPKGCQYFYSTPSTPGTSGSMSMTANPNLGGVPACTQTTSFNNPQNACTGLNWNYNNGQMCVSPQGTFNGQYQWTIGGNTPFNNGACQPVPFNTSVSVVGVGAPQCNVNIPPQTPPCLYVTPNYNGSQLCLNVNPSSFTGPFTWKIGNGAAFSNGLCQNVPPNTLVNVTGPTNACSLNNYFTPPNPPRFVKTVRALNAPESSQGEKGGSVALTLVPNIENKIVVYKLVFTPTSPNTTATIVDDISKGYIQGRTNTNEDGGRIVYNDNMTVKQGSVDVPQCSDALTSGCYSGDIGTGGIILKKISNEVTITYQGRVQDSKLTDKNCLDNTSRICQEKYPNIANLDYQVYESPAEDAAVLLSGVLRANALVQSFCQYILTRAAGDIYLETDLNFGKDIYLCSEYKSSTGLIVTPGAPPPPGAPGTGTNATVPIGHEVCSQGLTVDQQGNQVTLFGENAASVNLSSQICEVKLRPGESWSKATITSTIQENKTRISRWEPNLNSYSNLITTFDDSGLPSTNTGVYHISNSDLTIGDGFGTDIVLHDGQGAKTFIVENGDLIIKSNIKYGDCNKLLGICTVRDTASLAFIVLNGNVYIDPSVTEVSGVFFVQQGDDSESGRVKSLSSGDSFEKLTIFGSVYGDIQDLFTHHKFAGDPAANDGSVVIRFDERIILNTPPGLQDVLGLEQSEVAR